MDSEDKQPQKGIVLTEGMHKDHEANVLLQKERALATAAKLKALHQQASSSTAACAGDPARPSNASRAMQSDDKRSQKERMLAGDLYYAFDDELLQERQRTKAIMAKYNSMHQLEGRTELLQELLGGMDASDPPFIEPPFVCDYGSNIHIGAGSYMNFGCTVLDACKVTIGSRVLFGPNVQLYAASHPLGGHIRQGIRGPEYGKPITIGDDVWVGGAVVVCPGVTIGHNSVVGAGSVVTKDVEPYTVVAGNPAKVIRRLERPGEPQQQQQPQQQEAMLN